MPVTAADFFVPGSQFVGYILEDKYFKGGFRVFATIAERDQYIIDAKNRSFGIEVLDPRKKTMMCSVIENPGIIYYLGDDKETWLEYETGLSFTPDSPLEFLGENQERLAIQPQFLVPQTGKAPSKVLTTRLDGSIGWEFIGPSAGAGIRVSRTYQPLDSIATGTEHFFELSLGLTILLLEVTINTPDFEVKGYVTSNRDDRNPYIFRSDIDFLSDDGTMFQNGEYIFKRRFAIMANLSEQPSTLQYFSLKNLGPAASRPTITITALTLQ